MNPLVQRCDNAGDRQMISHMIGNALVVRPRHVLREETRDLALGLAADPEHELVVLDLPVDSSFAVWESAAKLMPRKRRGVRLVMGGRPRETTSLAGQWLSERLNRTVIAPDGSVMPGVDGSLFVDSGWSTGWVRFQPGKPPKLDGKRFPRPTWETAAALVEIMPTSAASVAEPVPGGVWLRPGGPESVLRAHREPLIESVPCQPDVCVVVLGCPGAPPVAIHDITRFWSWLSDDLRAKVRFAKFGALQLPGNTSYGQAVADALGERITFYTGIPIGSRTDPDVYTLRPDGTLGWQAFAEEVSYTPAAEGEPVMPPVLMSYRDPVFGVEEIAPAIYQYAPDVVLEVVQSGLWLRPPHELPHAQAIRAAEPDAARHLVLFEDGPEATSSRLRDLAEDVLAHLTPATRDLSGVLRAEPAVRQRVEAVGQAMGAIEPPPAVEPVISNTARESADPAPERVDPNGGSLAPEAATLRLESVGPASVPSMRHAVATEAALPAPYSPGNSPAAATAPSTPFAVPAPGTDLPRAHAPDTEPPQTTPARAAEAPAMLAAGTRVTDAPAATETTTAVPDPHSPPAPASAPGARPTTPAFVTTVQPIPAAAAAALIPKRGLEEERTWLLRTLSREYAAEVNSVGRVLSQHPGFQGALKRSSGGVLSDAVAIRLYLSGVGDGLDLPLRMGAVGPHVPFARCVVSGLSRLPSHRGATVFAASPTAEEWDLYRGRRFVTEWGFIHALSAPCAKQRQGNDVDVLLWSMTARRTKLVEPELNPTADRLVFVPGTSFKVLGITEPAEGKRGQVLLRELAAGEIDAAGRVDDNQESLDELALKSLRRCSDTWAEATGEVRITDAAAARFGLLPGLVRTTSAGEEGR